MPRAGSRSEKGKGETMKKRLISTTARFGLSTPVGRYCGHCKQTLKAGDTVYQIETDKGPIGFMYIHVECMLKKEPLNME